MPRYLFDTNVLLDFAIPARPQHRPAVGLVKALASEPASMLVAASSLKDVYYVFNRHYGDEAVARSVISQMRDVFDVVALDALAVDAALASDEPDFEDGLVRAVAELALCDFIVSRDVKAFRTSSCSRVDAGQALRALHEEKS